MATHSPVIFGELGRNIPSLVFDSDLFTKFILLILFLMSVVCWAVIYDRSRLYLRLRRKGRRLQSMLATRGLGASFETLKQHLPSVEGALLVEAKRFLENRKSGGSVARDATAADNPGLHGSSLKDLLDRRAVAEIEEMEKYLVLLATTVSAAPFLGLLGTVWGITDSFMSMGGQGTASIEVVGPGIAEALVSTIAGLATAIPAVVGYNLLLRHVRRQENSIELFVSRVVELAGSRIPEHASPEREKAYEKNAV
jgi:biopolymer transport protein TolQ